jgi:hypothetical protein
LVRIKPRIITGVDAAELAALVETLSQDEDA